MQSRGVALWRRRRDLPEASPPLPPSDGASPAKVQLAYRQMLTNDIAPALRELGLKGAGTAYVIPSETHWALVGFQGSKFNTAEAMKFTVNLKVVRRDTWRDAYADKPYIGKTPSANVHAGNFEWAHRIGKLMPADSDLWWSLRSGQDTGSIAADVIEALSVYGIPAMRAEIRATS